MRQFRGGCFTRAPALRRNAFWEIQWGQLDVRGVRPVRWAVIPGELLPRELQPFRHLPARFAGRGRGLGVG